MRLLRRAGLRWLVALATMAALGTGAANAQQRRVALVIGNSAYQHVTPLTNPGNDARLMANVLRALGFELVGGRAQSDLDRAGLRAVISSFQNMVAHGDIGLFYYSGHGLQVDGVNYLVPIDANLVSLADVDTQLVDASTALRAMQQPSTALKIFVLDACRNNPFGARGLRSPGLAEMRAPRGTIISYATQPGGVASDGIGAGTDSPYTTALAQALRAPGLEVVRAFNQVGLVVSRATDSAQEPWLALASIPGEFYLAGQRAGAAPDITVDTDQPGADTAMRTVPVPQAATSPPPVQATTDAPSELGRRYFGKH